MTADAEARERCSEEVPDRDSRWPSFHQCQRNAKVYRNGKWYCGQHDPVAVAKRDKERDERHAVQFSHDMLRALGRSFADALYEIAEGHDDPRQHAREALGKYYDFVAELQRKDQP